MPDAWCLMPEAFRQQEKEGVESRDIILGVYVTLKSKKKKRQEEEEEMKEDENTQEKR